MSNHMQVSDRGLVFIARHEAIVLGPYLDTVGVWTIGIGHTASAGDPDPQTCGEINVARVMEIFRKDIGKFEDRVNKAVKVPVEQHEFDALVSFDFNTGGIHRANLTKLLNAGDKVGAGAAFMGWLKPPEIKGRRTAERDLFLTGEYGGGRVALHRAENGKLLRPTFITCDELLAQFHRPVPRPEPARPIEMRPTPHPIVLKPAQPDGFWAAIMRAIAALFGKKP